MANEVNIDATLRYSDSEGTEAFLQLLSFMASVTTKRISRLKQNVGITEEALNLGDVTSLGYVALKNLDSTNFVNVKTGTAGTIFAKLKAGEIALFRVGSGVTAPFVIADTAACQLDILVCSN